VKRRKPGWNHSWDKDWEEAERELELKLEADHTPHPKSAIQFYRHGFAAAKRRPAVEWSEAEADIYQDYMSGLKDSTSEIPWEEAREWARAGWRAARAR